MSVRTVRAVVFQKVVEALIAIRVMLQTMITMMNIVQHAKSVLNALAVVCVAILIRLMRINCVNSIKTKFVIKY
ncbi:hypothetical protein HMPREF1585_00285 [Gardnerella vaginalis JCP8481B]|nr:hypothetical protein HMPREF1585_00285 [Gardnerella vaginalis JCP8481B]